MKHLVIGLGEVGKALQKVLDNCPGWDLSMSALGPPTKTDVLHVCFPYSGKFKDEVARYRSITGASYVVVHSTVPLGTCDSIGAIHSPVRGIHPNLEEGIRTFVKFFGGANAQVVAREFTDRGVKVYCTTRAADTEALKLWDTTQYGWDILIQKAIHEYCQKHGLDFSVVYSMANATYNAGYARLGRPEYTRYVLKHVPGAIGGHCVQQNWELLDHGFAGLSKTIHQQITEREEK